MGIVFLSLSLNASPLANWTPSVVGSNLHLGIISMAYGNGTILACEGWGDSGFTHTSRDGVNWSLRYGIFDVLTPYSATFGNGMFVTAGWGASIHTSMDGSNWTWRRVELQRPGLEPEWLPTFWNITYADGRFVAVGNGGDGSSGANSIASSLGGTNWYYAAPPVPQAVNHVAYGNGLFVATGATYGYETYPYSFPHFVFHSANGIAWTTNHTATNKVFGSVAFGNGRFVISGDSDVIPATFLSVDGTNWTQHSAPARFNLHFRHGLFFGFQLFGSNAVWTSTNGMDWQFRAALPEAPRAITIARDRILFGIRNKVYRSDPLVNLEALSAGTLRISGVPGLRCAILASSEIDAPPTQWQTLTTLVLSESPILYIDSQAAPPSKRFYRSELLE